MSCCHVCGNARLVYVATERVPPVLSAGHPETLVYACGADPRHELDLLVYDVSLLKPHHFLTVPMAREADGNRRRFGPPTPVQTSPCREQERHP